MKAAQVKAVLSDLGYSTDKIIPLTEVTAIVLEGNYNIYPDENLQIEFLTKNGLGLLLGFRGTRNESGEFIPNEKPNFAIAFDQIEGFILKTSSRIKAPYRFGMSI